MLVSKPWQAKVTGSSFEEMYEITKTEKGTIPIDSVTINDEKVTYNIRDNILTVIVNIKPKEITEIVIVYKDQFPENRQNASIIYKTKVLIRRYLSEFRDNYINKNKILHSVSQKLAQYRWYNQ